MQFLNEESWPGIIRAKGFFWLSTRPDFIGGLSQAGSLVRHEGMGVWWSSTDKSEWPDDPEFDELIQEKWDAKSGDKRQEIVFIGIKKNMDFALMKNKLDACLIRDYWDKPEKYKFISDPFPQWFEDQESA